MVRKQKRSKNKKIIILSALLIVALAAAAFLYMRSRNDNSPQTQTPNAETVDLSPATDEDKARADQNKQAIVDQEEALKNQKPSTSKRSVKPVITSAGQQSTGSAVKIRGYVPDTFEEGGTCTVTLSRNGSTSITRSVTAVTNVNAVDCPVTSINASDFPQKGSWTATITYTSASASGTSDGWQLEVK